MILSAASGEKLFFSAKGKEQELKMCAQFHSLKTLWKLWQLFEVVDDQNQMDITWLISDVLGNFIDIIVIKIHLLSDFF